MSGKPLYTVEKTRNILRAILTIVVIALVAAAVVYGCALYVNYLEVREIGEQFVSVFVKNTVTKITFSFICFALCFIIIYASTAVIRRNLDKANAAHSFFSKRLLIAFLCALVAFAASQYISSSLYEKFLLFQNSTSFNLADPILGKNISYYVFQRPFYVLLLDGITGTWGFVILYCAAAYFLLYTKIGERNFNDLVQNKPIMTHVIVNILIYLVLKMLFIRIDAQGLLTGQFIDELTGGGFVDMNIRMKFYAAAPFILLIITVTALVFLLKRKYLYAILSCLSYVVILILVNIAAFAVQTVYVSPNEVVAESKYIQHNIDFTRFGYNLTSVSEYEYDVSEKNQNVAPSDEAVGNIRIIDFPATLTATNQLQAIRSYYGFYDMDVGVYEIGGKKEAVAIGAREINKDNLSDSAKNYLNEKFRFTHGFGVAMAKINSVTDKGQPEYIIENLVPESAEGAPKIKQPRIYFGQMTEDSVIVNTKVRELDYSEGTKDIEFDYDGPAGIKLTFLNRILFAFRTGDFRMPIASQITNDSRLLLNRDITERVKKAAPFFKYDTNPVIVIDDDGSLKWVIDGYTISSELPYSQYTDGYNYIRNSLKVTVDAYTGEVKFYKLDSTDPIVNAYEKMYPALFESEPISQSILSKSKYPEALFSTQCKIYTQYHTTDPAAFYNKNDMYAVANEKYQDDIRPIEPYYNIMKLKKFNENDSELVLMLPFTLINRENMVSWIAVGNEGENYGKLVAYKFPKNYTVYGPLQIENMIDNDPDISKEMTLWNTGGSNVIRGNLLVIPLEHTMLYVEPVYITTDNQASLPLLKRVIVGCGDNIVMGENLTGALSQLFGVSEPSPSDVTDGGEEANTQKEDTAQKISDVENAYKQVQKSAESGNWTEFGKAMDALGSAISSLSENNSKTE